MCRSRNGRGLSARRFFRNFRRAGERAKERVSGRTREQNRRGKSERTLRTRGNNTLEQKNPPRRNSRGVIDDVLTFRRRAFARDDLGNVQRARDTARSTHGKDTIFHA